MKFIELGKIAEFINGYAFKPTDWSNTGVKIVRIQNLTSGEKSFNRTTKSVPDKYLIRKGDILVSWSATLDVFEWYEEENALLNQHIFLVKPFPDLIGKKYFKYVLGYSIAEMSNFTHGSTMKHIVRKDFLKHKIPLPSIEKQQHIVKILDLAQSLIEKRKQAISYLDDYIKAVFLDMFGDPVSNPKGWEVEKFANLGTLDRGKSKNRPRNSPELLGGTHPLIQTGDIANSNIYIENYVSTYSDIGLKQSKKWQKGTLCITIAANIAKTGILGFDACFPDSVVGFIADTTKTNTIFIHFWMSFFQKILEDNAPESAQKNINLRILRDLKVICPPLQIQDKFALTVQKVVSAQKIMLSQLKELENNFQAELQRAFRGE